MAVQSKEQIWARQECNGRIAVPAMVLAGIAGFLGMGLFVWPDLFSGLHSGRYPIVLLAAS